MSRSAILIFISVVMIFGPFSSMHVIAQDLDLLLVPSTDLELLAASGINLLARLTDKLICSATHSQQVRLAEYGLDYQVLDSIDTHDMYYLVYPMYPVTLPEDWSETRVLYQEPGLYCMQMSESEAEYLVEQAGMEVRWISQTPKPFFNKAITGYGPIEGHPVVLELLQQIDVDLLYHYCGNLSGYNVVEVGGNPHTIVSRHSKNTEQIEKATQYVYEYMQGLGYPVSYFYFDGPGQRDVIAVKEGVHTPDEFIIICAHLDDMPPGNLAPGADDNASGSVAVMVAAELLRDIELDRSIIFALWTGEEQGLHGSSAYAEHVYREKLDVLAVINFDMIAWDTVNGPIIELHANKQNVPQSMELAEYMASVIETYQLNLTTQLIGNGTGASDHAPFWDYGIPAILGIEDFNDFNDYYHTVNDRLEYLNLPYFTEFVKAALATLVHLAHLPGMPSTGDIDQSGRIDGIDLILLCRALGTSQGDEDYLAEADLDGSGSIDEQDLALLVEKFGLVLPGFY
ncbi:M20/M25/M40 family metallo-hydrolase [bacterium]|nr:M20/M25/M40 family metallo-hydrolase [bacterium]